jgi:hypothetical protein
MRPNWQQRLGSVTLGLTLAGSCFTAGFAATTCEQRDLEARHAAYAATPAQLQKIAFGENYDWGNVTHVTMMTVGIDTVINGYMRGDFRIEKAAANNNPAMAKILRGHMPPLEHKTLALYDYALTLSPRTPNTRGFIQRLVFAIDQGIPNKNLPHAILKDWEKDRETLLARYNLPDPRLAQFRRGAR